MLPPHLVDQIQYCTVVAPLFCYNYVEYHLPHLVARQFEALDEINLSSVGSDLRPIIHKANKGRREINFKKHYEREIMQWEDFDNRLAQSYRPGEASTSRPEEEASTSRPGEAFASRDEEEPIVEDNQRSPELNLEDNQRSPKLNFEDNQLFSVQPEHEAINYEVQNAGKEVVKQRRKKGLATPPSQVVPSKIKNRGVHAGKFTHSETHADNMMWKKNQRKKRPGARR